MLFNRLFKRHRKDHGTEQNKNKEKKNTQEKTNPDVTKGLTYMYLVIGLQLVLLFGLMVFMMVIGKVITTPWWIFLIVFSVTIGGCIYLYYTVKKQFRKLKEAVKEMKLSDRNYEISIMGGALSMRVEQNPNRLLEAPPDKRVVDAVIVESHTVVNPTQQKD